MRTKFSRSLSIAGVAFAVALMLTAAAHPEDHAQDYDQNDWNEIPWGQHTSGVLSRVGIEDYPVGCSSDGNPTDQTRWTNASGSSRCSIASEQENVDGLVVLVNWSTLQPDHYNEPLSSYYIDNAIYSLAHPERQSIRLGVLTGTHSPDWLITAAGASFPDRFGKGMCKPADPSAGGPTNGVPGTIWNNFAFPDRTRPMPNPIGSNTCLFTALDNLVDKLGQTGDYNYPSTDPSPRPLAPYDDLYYDSAPGRAGFVHTNRPTATMNKIIGHVSVLGPASYDDESVLCQEESECETASTYNFKLWQSLEPNDFAMEAAIEDAQKSAIDVYASHFPASYWTMDLVERQMPFFTPTGCNVPSNPYPPSKDGQADVSDCFGKLRTDLIDYIRTHYSWHGGVQNNSLGADATQLQNHPVWQQTALAAQGPPFNSVKLFVGFEVGDPNSFYKSGDRLFQDFEADDQGAVNLAKQMVTGYRHVDFIEFYDVDIANDFTLAQISPDYGVPLMPPPHQTEPASSYVNMPVSALNDAPNGVTSGGFMYVPLTDAHLSLRGRQFPDDHNGSWQGWHAR